LVPRRSWFGGVELMNDAMLMRAYWRQEYAALSQPGRSLDACVAMRQLCDDLGAEAGAIHETLAIARLQTSLEDVEAARATLSDAILSGPSRGSIGRRVEIFERATLAAVADPATAGEILRIAETDLHDDPYAVLSLRLVAAQMRFESGTG